MRLAIVKKDLCKPRRCNKECVRFCPINRSGAKCVEIIEDKARISEPLCLGCGICVKKCPFRAITIVNLPDEYERRAVHRYGPNAFKLYGLPIPQRGRVIGIIGPNGTGKSTALKILGGRIRPNLGRIDEEISWSEILRFFRGSELQNYFDQLASGRIRAVYKPQEVSKIPQILKGRVGEILSKIDERGLLREISKELNLNPIWNRRLTQLSGGELQKFAIAAVLIRDVDVYLIDEPSSFLDIRERLKLAGLIRRLATKDKYTVVVEHDLVVLDYISDSVHIVYGEPGAYGIFSLPRGVRVGVNAYLRGYLREENILIRDEPIRFKLNPVPIEWRPEDLLVSWSSMIKVLGDFKLYIEPGEIHRGEVIGILGPNGIGKTTFVKLLAGIIKPDKGYVNIQGELKVSYKPQFLAEMELEGTLYEHLKYNVGVNPEDSHIKSNFLRPLGLLELLERDLNTLSGGELQRVAIASCLLRDADVYLIDEPMAYLDVEYRLIVAKLIRRITEERKAATFVVEHDIIAQDFVSDSIMVFLGTPGVSGHAYSPEGLHKGMNRFLSDLEVTFRRDRDTGRPRVNKPGSWLDRYQKEVLKEYYYMAPLEEPEH
ncbi:MAG: ribosome biogenesis/translation initiation ATPase RLI [Thermoprotei archaeon]|nr:MAG: ribosome biogenesis/translation initiation ATPase RLI [Thermoprotei archaeon]RLE88863.1 MAG: ribosome biogenesis/translation initiation ATPase RLI [Thermoprotei archaeon]